MPPLTLIKYLKPCSFRKLSALSERTPLLQEIQERQDHVQRAQADIAAREAAQNTGT